MFLITTNRPLVSDTRSKKIGTKFDSSTILNKLANSNPTRQIIPEIALNLAIVRKSMVIFDTPFNILFIFTLAQKFNFMGDPISFHTIWPKC